MLNRRDFTSVLAIGGINTILPYKNTNSDIQIPVVHHKVNIRPKSGKTYSVVFLHDGSKLPLNLDDGELQYDINYLALSAACRNLNDDSVHYTNSQNLNLCHNNSIESFLKQKVFHQCTLYWTKAVKFHVYHNTNDEIGLMLVTKFHEIALHLNEV